MFTLVIFLDSECTIYRTCFEWESRKSNIIALIIWLLFCWFFKIWMLPLLLLIPFVMYRPPNFYLINCKYIVESYIIFHIFLFNIRHIPLLLFCHTLAKNIMRQPEEEKLLKKTNNKGKATG